MFFKISCGRFIKKMNVIQNTTKEKKRGEGEGNNGCIDKFMLYIEATFYLM
jgi:hypothetical protein